MKVKKETTILTCLEEDEERINEYLLYYYTHIILFVSFVKR